MASLNICSSGSNTNGVSLAKDHHGGPKSAVSSCKVFLYSFATLHSVRSREFLVVCKTHRECREHLMIGFITQVSS